MVESVVRHIDRMIGDGSLKPGDRISEPSLIATLNIGRVPVREGIRILAGEGVLDLVPNRSARVRTPDATEILEMLDVLTGFSVSAIYLLSNRKLDPGDAEALQSSADLVMKLARQNESTKNLAQEINRYHSILIKASGNSYLLKLMRKTRIAHYTRNLTTLLGRQAFLEAAPKYQKITAAIARGNPNAAIQILLRSVERSKSFAKID